MSFTDNELTQRLQAEQPYGFVLVPAQRAVPGHGPVSAWPAALADQRRYLGTLAADVRALVAGGKPITEAAAHAGEAERPRWQLFDDYNARNATAAFSEIEWE